MPSRPASANSCSRVVTICDSRSLDVLLNRANPRSLLGSRFDLGSQFQNSTSQRKFAGGFAQQSALLTHLD